MRRSAVLAASLSLPLILAAGRVSAQTNLRAATAAPGPTTVLFLRALRAIRWHTVAELLHPDALAHFREVVTTLSDADTTGTLRRWFTGTRDARTYAALDDTAVFERAVGHTIDSLPGLMHSLYDHDDRVLGHVMVGADTAEVVYRTVERLSGAVPDVLVAQLARTPDGWRVLWVNDLAVIEEALRGVRRAMEPGVPHASQHMEQSGTFGRTHRMGHSGREVEPWVYGSVGRMQRTSP
jgi:hypothetical protein